MKLESIVLFGSVFFAVLAFILFGIDKRKAGRHKWRISERTLLLVSFFGGIGGLCGMFFFHHKTKKLKFRILEPLFAFIQIIVIAFILWSSVYYHADSIALAAMQSDETVTVIDEQYGWLFDGPSEDSLLIFYQGAKVEAEAYAPLLHQLAQKGTDVYLVDMPFNLAFFNQIRTGKILEEFPYETCLIGGHSLGGAMAAYYAAGHEDAFEGVVLLAAYPTKTLDMDATLLYGTEDQVLNLRRVETAEKLVSGKLSETVIEGGNHAQFGNYGKQQGDGEAIVSWEEQQAITVEAVLEMKAFLERK